MGALVSPGLTPEAPRSPLICQGSHHCSPFPTSLSIPLGTCLSSVALCSSCYGSSPRTSSEKPKTCPRSGHPRPCAPPEGCVLPSTGDSAGEQASLCLGSTLEHSLNRTGKEAAGGPVSAAPMKPALQPQMASKRQTEPRACAARMPAEHILVQTGPPASSGKRSTKGQKE